MKESDLITKTEAAKQLDISITSLNRWIEGGKISAYKYKNRIMIDQNEVNNILTPKKIDPKK